MPPYTPSNTDWLAACAVGIGVHWTALTAPRQGAAQTAPRRGAALPFPEAVARFRLDDFFAAVEAAGADYVLFTATHALQMFPCPHPVVDAILPGRTAERDLIGELAEGLERRGKKLIVYYNHSCNGGDDPVWEQAVGYHDNDKHRLAENLLAIVRWMGERYGSLIAGWWFDSPYSLDPRGPHNSITTDLRGFQFPWEEMTRAAKAGHAERLVTYNAGIGETFLYTTHQDYWSGELTDLNSPPAGRYLENGLQWHGWTALDDRRWVYTDNSTDPHPPLYSDDELTSFLARCRNAQAPMCFNVVSFQDGTLAEASVEQLARVTAALKH